jgi:hypothetical protein
MDDAGFLAESLAPTARDIEDRVEHRYAENEVRNHYATLGEGPLILMLHGFPDY